jgi:protein ImuB
MLWVALQALPEAETSRLADCVASLVWWALQFTPKVARVDDMLVLELSASERLWRGRVQLLRQIHESSKTVAAVKLARGATSLLAMARLQSTRLARSRPDDLPLFTLAAARPHLATLERIGCTSWGQLRALPRAGVTRRFGAPLLDALDRAYGLAPELYPWLTLPEVFDVKLELPSQVETAQALVFGARRLLNQLQVWLQLRHCGVLALELSWTMDARRDTAVQGELVLRTAEPATDTTHLQRLLAEQLAHIRLPAPVLALHLRSLETQKLRGQSASLLPDAQATGDSLQQLVERLSARLGAQQVLQAQGCAEYRPERMQTWQPVADSVSSRTHANAAMVARDRHDFRAEALYPSWLLAVPLKLALREQCPQYGGPLTLLAGPQRLEVAWWDAGDCALRDYFVARSARRGLVWIFRERLAAPGSVSDVEPTWYLHGLFA